MAFAPKLLAEGQLAIVKTAVYTAPGATSAYVRTIKLFNTNAITQTINVYISTGTSRQTYRLSLQQNETGYIDDRITLETGDLIEADTTTATAVDFTVHGVEEA